MDKEILSGVYAITNKVTGEQYIGSSGRTDLRWEQHQALLQQGKHHNQPLQEAFNRYGLGAFL